MENVLRPPGLAAPPRAPADAAAPAHWGAVFAMSLCVFALGLLAAGLFFMGQFALFTYLRPFLETVTRVDGPTLSLVLLLVGVAGLVGTALIGRVLAIGFYGTLAGIPVVMAAVAAGLVAFGASAPAVAVLLGVWGLVATAAPVGWWTWISRTLPDDAEAGGGLIVAVVQLSIALGATVGGLLYDGAGWPGTVGFSGALLLIGAFLVYCTARAEPDFQTRS